MQSKKTKPQIAIYPGFFNPFHKQHERIVKFLIQQKQIVKIWIYINKSNRSKTNLIPWLMRWKIIKKRFINEPKVIVKTKVATYITNHLFERDVQSNKLKNHHFWLILGSDNWNKLDEWEEIEELKTKTDFLVLERTGYKLKSHLQLNIRMQTMAIKPQVINSTAIRNGYNWKWLHQTTRNFLHSHKFYYPTILKNQLSVEKYEHVWSVYHFADKLKRYYKLEISNQNLYLSCLFHDFTKNWNKQQHHAFYQKHDLDFNKLINLPFPVWHGKTSAWYLQKELMLKNQKVFRAIWNHTTAAAKMSNLAKLVFIADKFEPLKTFKKSNEIQKLIHKLNFTDLFSYTLKMVINNLLKQKKNLTKDILLAKKIFIN